MTSTIGRSIERIGGSYGKPDLIYYNADIINSKTFDEGSGTDPASRFNETRDTAIIPDASEYDFSIVRFSLNGGNKLLPILIPQVEIGQADANKTIYWITLRLSVSLTIGKSTFAQTFTAKAPIMYNDRENDVPVPSAPLTQQSVSTDYYYIYVYSHFVDLVNQAFSAVMSNSGTTPYTPYIIGSWTSPTLPSSGSLTQQFNDWYVAPTGANQPSPPPALKTTAPILRYNNQTNIFSIFCNTQSFGGAGRQSVGTAQDESCRLFFNSNLWGLLTNYNYYYWGGDLTPNNPLGQYMAYEILVSNTGNNVSQFLNNIGTATGAYYFEVRQDMPSTSSLWSPISSIVFTSSLLPVVSEATGAPINFGSGNALLATTTQSAFSPIITDVQLYNEDASTYSQFIQYVPSAEYRIASMSSSPQEIRSIDIQVFWKNRLDGNLYPVRLLNSSSISIKIMFRRRGSY